MYALIMSLLIPWVFTKTEKAEPLADFLFFPGILFFQALWKRHVQAGAIVNISGGRQEA